MLTTEVGFKCKPGALTPWERLDAWRREANGYRCQLRFRGRAYSFDFWQGTGILEGPTLLSAISSLFLDARCAEQPFEEWCAEFGEDVDSRRALKTWTACKRVHRGLARLFGSDFEYAMREAEALDA